MFLYGCLAAQDRLRLAEAKYAQVSAEANQTEAAAAEDARTNLKPPPPHLHPHLHSWMHLPQLDAADGAIHISMVWKGSDRHGRPVAYS